ncbi:lysozyme [Xanthomonas phage DES1]|nr:lysozyme [Xanthomonas phage DES1]
MIFTTAQTKLYRQVVADLKRHEGYKFYAYADPLSSLYKLVKASLWGTKPARELLPKNTDFSKGTPWTVGIGYTKGVNVDSTMEEIKAERITEQEVAEIDTELKAKLSFYDTSSFVTKTILINMAYNMGIKGLLSFRNTLNFIKAGNYAQAARNMEQSLWFRQTKVRAQELVKRMETQTIPQGYLV